MTVRFWGTRGAIASPGPETAELGGNTTCVQIALGQAEPLLVDCGTGITEYALADGARAGGGPFHILISHFHWDHVLGFPFFFPIHSPEATIHLYAPYDVGTIVEHLEALFDGTYSPLQNMNNLPATIVAHSIGEGGQQIAGVQVSCCPTDHTDPCYAYRFERDGQCIGVATDHESRDNEANTRFDRFMTGVDLLVHGAQFTEDQYVAGCHDRGHSSIERAIATGERVGAKRLLLTHHHPLHSDDRLRLHLARTLRSEPRGLPVELAREGVDYPVG